MIEIKNLHKFFGNVEVLKGVDVSIEEKDGSLIVSSVPAAGRPPEPPSPVKFQDSPDGQSKIISLPVSKK